MKILLIDNFDSFTQNIAQYLYELTGVCVDVVTNTVPYRELNIENYDAVVLSPGHGHPGSSLDFGVCGDVILQSPVPCLGFAWGIKELCNSSAGRSLTPLSRYMVTAVVSPI